MIIVNACQKDLFRVDLNILQVIWHDIDLYFCQFSQNVTGNCFGFVLEIVYLFFGLTDWSMDDKSIFIMLSKMQTFSVRGFSAAPARTLHTFW